MAIETPFVHTSKDRQKPHKIPLSSRYLFHSYIYKTSVSQTLKSLRYICPSSILTSVKSSFFVLFCFGYDKYEIRNISLYLINWQPGGAYSGSSLSSPARCIERLRILESCTRGIALGYPLSLAPQIQLPDLIPKINWTGRHLLLIRLIYFSYFSSRRWEPQGGNGTNFDSRWQYTWNSE